MSASHALSAIRRAVAAALSAAALLVAPPAPGATLAGVNIVPLIQSPAGVLQAVACGVRDTLWIEHYVAALYVPRGESLHAVRDDAYAKAVRLHIVDASHLPDEIPEKWRTALETKLDASSMRAMRSSFAALRNGDVVTILYTPRHGVTMTVNERRVVRARGHAAIDAVLTAWTEEEPLQSRLERLRREHPC